MRITPSQLRFLLIPLISLYTHTNVNADSVRLGNISITAAPYIDIKQPNASVVDKERLDRLSPATSDTAGLLKTVPGLNLQGSGGVSSLPVIHGLPDDRLRIKVDGMDLISACGNHMNPALSYIDPTAVGNATVFAGISPVSTGGDSIGGTILVDSEDPVFATNENELLQSGEIGTFYRSNGHARGANLAATIANESLNLTYRASTAKADDYKAGDDFKAAGPSSSNGGFLQANEVGSTMYKSSNQSLALALKQENHLVELKVSQQDIPYQGWVNQRMDMTGNDSIQTNLRYEGEYDWGGLEARLYHENTEHSMQFFTDKLFWYGPNSTAPATDGIACTPSGGPEGCAAGMPMDTEGKNTGANVKAEIMLSDRDLLRVGSDIQQYRLDDWWAPSGKGMWPNTFVNINEGERDRLALFAEWEAEWNPIWLTQFGLRGEQVNMNTGVVQGYNTMADYPAESAAFNAADRKKTDNNIDLTALARYTPEKTQSIEFGYAQKTRSPNLYERYTWSTGGMAMRMINMAGDGNGYVGNLDLEPEISHTVSATFDWHDAAQKNWGLKISPYYTHVDNYIDAQRCSSAVNTNCGAANQTATTGFVYLQFVNQSANIHGVDISGYLPVTEHKEYGSFSATGLINYVRGENDTTNDNLYNMMPLNAKLSLIQKQKNWNNSIEVEMVDKKTDVSQMRNEVQTKGYGLIHLRSSYQWKQLSFNVGIENVHDKSYSHPLGGVYLGQGKTMSGTGVPWGVTAPAMGRSIYAGVNLKF